MALRSIYLQVISIEINCIIDSIGSDKCICSFAVMCVKFEYFSKINLDIFFNLEKYYTQSLDIFNR